MYFLSSRDISDFDRTWVWLPVALLTSASTINYSSKSVGFYH